MSATVEQWASAAIRLLMVYYRPIGEPLPEGFHIAPPPEDDDDSYWDED